MNDAKMMKMMDELMKLLTVDQLVKSDLPLLMKTKLLTHKANYEMEKMNNMTLDEMWENIGGEK